MACFSWTAGVDRVFPFVVLLLLHVCFHVANVLARPDADGGAMLHEGDVVVEHPFGADAWKPFDKERAKDGFVEQPTTCLCRNSSPTT